MSAAPYVVAVGDANANTNFKGAVWAFDVVKYAWPGLELWIVGDGPLMPDVRAFADSLGRDDPRVRFLGWVPKLDDVLREATACVLTYRTGGVALVQRAVPLGVPVIAMHNAELASLAGVHLVPINDHVAMASAILAHKS